MTAYGVHNCDASSKQDVTLVELVILAMKGRHQIENRAADTLNRGCEAHGTHFVRSPLYSGAWVLFVDFTERVILERVSGAVAADRLAHFWASVPKLICKTPGASSPSPLSSA